MKKKYNRHNRHECEVRPVLKESPHKYEVFCLQCKKHVQWAKPELYRAYLALQAEEQE